VYGGLNIDAKLIKKLKIMIGCKKNVCSHLDKMFVIHEILLGNNSQ